MRTVILVLAVAALLGFTLQSRFDDDSGNVSRAQTAASTMYEYEVLPGLQKGGASRDNPDNLNLTCGWHDSACNSLSSSGGALDMVPSWETDDEDRVYMPVYLAVEAITPDPNSNVVARIAAFGQNSYTCYYVSVEFTEKTGGGGERRLGIITYTHVLPISTLYDGKILQLPRKSGETVKVIIGRVARSTWVTVTDKATIDAITDANLIKAPGFHTVTVGNKSVRVRWLANGWRKQHPTIDAKSDGENCATIGTHIHQNGDPVIVPTRNDGFPTESARTKTEAFCSDIWIYKIQLSGTPTASSLETCPSKPTAPASLAATPGDGQISLVWTNPNTGRKDVIASYELRWKESTILQWGPWHSIGTGTTTSHIVKGLSNGRGYSIELRAVSARPMRSDASTVTATPVKMYTLTTQVGSGGGGGVTPSGTTKHRNNAKVEITAAAAPGSPGHLFGSFSGCKVDTDGVTGGGTQASCTVTMDQDRTVTASFISAESAHNLTVTKGTGGKDIECEVGTTKVECSRKFVPGTVVKLTAEESDGFDFVHWAIVTTGGSATSTHTSNPYDFTVPTGAGATTNVTAVFQAESTPVVTITRQSPSTGSMTEGGTATFQLSRTGATTAALSVALSVTETGSTISGTPPASLSIPASASSATFTVATVNDTVDEANSTITATVSTGSGYTPGTPSSATVIVNDNDVPPQCTVIVSMTGTGSGGYSGSTTVNCGTSAVLTAIPSSTSAFSSWSSCDSVSDKVCTVTVNAGPQKTVFLAFALKRHTLTTSATGGGSVSPSGTNTYNHGTTVNVKANWNKTTHQFDGWSGACTHKNETCSVTMTSNKSASAAFSVKKCTLTTKVSGGGSVTPTQIVNCGQSASATGTASSGHCFSHWHASLGTTAPASGNCQSTGAVSYSSLTTDITVTAYFVQGYTLTVTPSGTGSVTPSGGTYKSGSSVTLTATWNSATHTFDGWGGACSGKSSTCSVTMNANKSVTATFSKKKCTLTVNAGTGGTAGPGTSVVDCGTKVSIWANASTGYCFTGWTSSFASAEIVDESVVGDASCTTYKSSRVTVSVTMTVTASFERLMFTLTVTGGSGSGSYGAYTYASASAPASKCVFGTLYTFKRWSGDSTSTSRSISVYMNRNKSIAATWNLYPFSC